MSLLLSANNRVIAQSPFCNVPLPDLQRRYPGERSLVIIDTSVEDYQTLVAGVIPGHEVYLLEADQCGITQITQILREQMGIASLHIVSHGKSGELQLGRSVLNLENLPAYTTQLQVWRSALAENAEILLYGCEVAQGELGKAFVNTLSQLTAANIAASDNLTGSRALGGDWTLACNTGEIRHALAFAHVALEKYAAILGSLDFQNPITFSPGLGGEKRGITAGDFNGDQNLDLAVISVPYHQISVLLGNGNGTFLIPHTTLNAGSMDPWSASDITSGDFNGDNKLDLIVSTFDSVFLGASELLFLSGNGDGTFANSISFNSGLSSVKTITSGDFNQDGKLDLVTGDGNTISIILGNGDSTFSSPVTINSGVSGINGISAGDLNKDGNLDLAVVTQGNQISVLLGNGNSTFGSPIILGSGLSGSGSKGINIGDFNNDGNPDLAANDWAGMTSVQLGDGTGISFGAVQQFSTGLPNENTDSISGDFNNDGSSDLTVVNYRNYPQLSVLLSVFNSPNTAPSFTSDATLSAINEDTLSSTGDTLTNLFAGKFSDPDAGSSLGGVAVVGNTANAATQGTWQYSTDSGSNWFDVGSVADDNSALALSAATRVRFLPVAEYNGTPPSLTVRALDNTQTAFTNGGTRITINAAVNGGTTAISAATRTIDTSITAVNDAPTLASVNSVSLTDTAANDTFSNVAGTLVGNDVDTGTP
ncbi:MAG: DUF4347 domain-containing protein [Leptolyngbyaceae cyanobacterium SM2_5_2]|nr:DUF4347 domain-containing protein [Leptolyngbyaceae cyanobacterium SM2_5_2]